jgi:8-oxo-dGTP diphosphatase
MSMKRPVRLSASETWLRLSIILNVFLIASLIVVHRNSKSSNAFNLRSPDDASLVGKRMIFNGGYPSQERSGQCWCSADKYCMCTPSLAIDLIIASGPDHVWLVRRMDTQQLLATMGGYVQVGETVESAVARELMEEMGVALKETHLHLFGIYSDPRRDNRRSTASVVFAVHLDANYPLHPRAADDVKDVQRIALDDLDQHAFFSDHKTILLDYKRSVDQRKKTSARQNYGDFATDIVRSTCSSL